MTGHQTRYAVFARLVAFGAVFVAAPPTPAVAITVTDGPIVLHSNVCGQWGGHTFSYLLQGERCFFWSAVLNEGAKDERGKDLYAKRLVGQFPLPGTDGAPAVHTFLIDEPRAYGGPAPLLCRTPDGYLHLIIGTNHYSEDPNVGPGTLRYYRSARPEDVTEWVDRTELVPRTPYGEFHLRMNFAVTPDGQRAVIVILAVSLFGKGAAFNTPVIFYGKRDGLDFRFAPGVKYHEPMGFFYPNLAALPGGVVIVGSLWEYGSWNTHSELIHLDWRGKILHEEALPAGPREGAYEAYDMRPERPGDLNRLVIYQGFHPKQGQRRHQFLTYDLAARKLTLARDIAVEEWKSNAGKWLYISPGRSVFINNPSMGQFHAWEGDLLGGGEVTAQPLPRTNPLEIGYLGSEYTMVPDPLQGSVETPGVAYLMSDLINPNKSPERPCSLVLWRLSLR